MNKSNIVAESGLGTEAAKLVVNFGRRCILETRTWSEIRLPLVTAITTAQHRKLSV